MGYAVDTQSRPSTDSTSSPTTPTTATVQNEPNRKLVVPPGNLSSYFLAIISECVEIAEPIVMKVWCQIPLITSVLLFPENCKILILGDFHNNENEVSLIVNEISPTFCNHHI
ncbi:hypothetical protein TNCV_3272321 [Trichonephila clavipes]|nr:hypothetical protein TNCV_3272321 [Trichonephila clavipes]